MIAIGEAYEAIVTRSSLVVSGGSEWDPAVDFIDRLKKMVLHLIQKMVPDHLVDKVMGLFWQKVQHHSFWNRKRNCTKEVVSPMGKYWHMEMGMCHASEIWT